MSGKTNFSGGQICQWEGGDFLIFFWWQSGDSHAISRQSNCRQLSHFAICRQSKYQQSINRLSTFLPPRALYHSHQHLNLKPRQENILGSWRSTLVRPVVQIQADARQHLCLPIGRSLRRTASPSPDPTPRTNSPLCSGSSTCQAPQIAMMEKGDTNPNPRKSFTVVHNSVAAESKNFYL